ncbi:tetratricopeptide repeat protein [Shewanella algae]|uniref:tetratricopeptide repeat protein n=1 Tax=Shewanella algae TaxID=38313 RepID=UPI0034D76C1D
MTDDEAIVEAEQYFLKASFILNDLQANIRVYGSNSALVGAQPADVDLALQYIDRSLEISPENHAYLNLKALLLWEGKKDKLGARDLLQKAAQIAPRDIDIQNNLKVISGSQCFIATAAYGTPMAEEINSLRKLRDDHLMHSLPGKIFVSTYNKVSPPIAEVISRNLTLMFITRRLLKPIIMLANVITKKGLRR